MSTEAVDYDPFAGSPLEKAIPTTAAQKEIWLSTQMGVDASLAYNESITLFIEGELSQTALHHALGQVVNHHEALRGSVSPDGELLSISEKFEPALPIVDLSELSDSDFEAAFSQLLLAETNTPFDLEFGPLFRVKLVRKGQHSHRLIITSHHIVCDGWSLSVILRELAQFYRKELGLEYKDLSAQRGSFGEYAASERELSQSSHGEQDLKFWLSQIEAEPQTLDLPLSYSRPRERTFDAQRIDYLLPSELVRDLKMLSSRQGVSFFSVMFGAFNALVSRISGAKNFFVAVPTAGQARQANSLLVGHCVNALPFPAKIESNMTFAELLRQTAGGVFDMSEHMDCTFGSILAHLKIKREPNRIPLVPIMFNLDKALPQASYKLAECDVRYCTNPRSFENFEWYINAVEDNGTVLLECQFNSRLFSRDTVEAWLRSYEQVLRCIPSQLDAKVSEISLLHPLDESRLVHQLNDTDATVPSDYTVLQSFARTCASTPDKIAVRDSHRAFTYEQVSRLSVGIASRLREHGVKPGNRIAFISSRCADIVPIMLGIWRAGASIVPLDRDYPAARIASVLKQSAATLVVHDGSNPFLDKVLLASEYSNICSLHSSSLLLEDVPTAPESAPLHSSEDIAYVLFTSGSTGDPKGVMVSHSNLQNFLYSMSQSPGMNSSDSLLAVTTTTFDISFLELLLPLVNGAELFIASEEVCSDARSLAGLIDSYQPTILQATPAAWKLILGAGWGGNTKLKALCGGEALSSSLASELMLRVHELWNMYGPTETTIWSTVQRITDAEDISIGKPILNTRAYVVDSAGFIVPPGVPGELLIAGNGVTAGYLGNPEQTALRFQHDILGESVCYRTGDIAQYRADGSLECLGRNDHQLKIRGFRLEAEEVESHICLLTEVKDAVVTAYTAREDDVRLVAYVVLHPNSSLTTTLVRNHLKSTLPKYMVPQHVIFLDEMPLSSSGKVDRKNLPSPFAAQQEASDDTPITPTERFVAEIWSKHLSISPGRSDNFFDLGGHSLLAMKVIVEIEQSRKIRLSPRLLLLEPLSQIASFIETHLEQSAEESLSSRPSLFQKFSTAALGSFQVGKKV